MTRARRGSAGNLILETGAGAVTAPESPASAAIGHEEGGSGGTAEVLVAAGAQGFAMGWVEPADPADTCRIRVSSEGGFAFGSVAGQGNGYTGLIDAAGTYGSFASGRAYPYGGNCSIIASNDGATARGYVGAYAATVEATAIAAFAHGIAYGYAGDVARIRASGNGSFAFGDAGGGTIDASQRGAFAQGMANTDGHLLSSGQGSFAQGHALGTAAYAAYITASERGAFAQGYSSQSCTIQATARGAFAQGYCDGSDGYAGTIGATNEGAFAQGYAVAVSAAASVNSSGEGSSARGYAYALGSAAVIQSTATGSFASGSVQGYASYAGLVSAGSSGAHALGSTFGGTVSSGGQGSLANGYSNYDGSISAGGTGSFAAGVAFSEGLVDATAYGSFAMGYTSDTGSIIRSSAKGAFALGFAEAASTIFASAEGSLAGGRAEDAYVILASAEGSIAWGYAKTANIGATADNAVQFGQGTNNVADSLQVGSAFWAQPTGMRGAPNSPLTLGAAATTFAVGSNVMTITGDVGGNTVATITGGLSGMELTLIFVDALVTITDNNAHAANSVDLAAAFTSADDVVLKLVFDGTSWYEVSRSVN